jgi:seryl-tRNA synthetase
MLDIRFIRQNLETVKTNCKNRGIKVDVDRLLSLDETRRQLLSQIEEGRAARNKASKVKPGPDEIARMRKLGEELKKLELELQTVETAFNELHLKVPNLSHPDSPVGGEDAYKVVKTEGKVPHFDFAPRDHEKLMTELDVLDFERGAKVAAAKFYFYKNDMVRLNHALLSYGIDVVTRHGYTLVETPDIARNTILTGIGFNPRGEETQVYSIENTDLSLIGTAEITMGGYHADEILDLEAGSKKYAALSHCFRTEAGSYGRTSKGLYRVHQFTKLEMFVYCKPEDSEKMHQELLAIEEEICSGLDLAYRVIEIPTGDLGGPAYRKYDIEAWMTMKGEGKKQGDYSEITSTSNCTDYQARRLNIRYRKPDGSTEIAHTLNGTGVVLSRFPLALFEQNQQADGSVKIPKILQAYLNGQKTISQKKS